MHSNFNVGLIQISILSVEYFSGIKNNKELICVKTEASFQNRTKVKEAKKKSSNLLKSVVSETSRIVRSLDTKGNRLVSARRGASREGPR